MDSTLAFESFSINSSPCLIADQPFLVQNELLQITRAGDQP